MAESSFWWTTSDPAVGDGLVSYTQVHLGSVARVLAACSGFEGVAPGYLNELACTANGANTVAVNTGGAAVDGKAYANSASVDVNIPSASGAGNTRIDRIVARADWTAQTVRITRIAGTDAASPSAPAITQTSGTTYDISLCTVLVDTGGTVTVTDARTFAKGGVNSISSAAITTVKLYAGAVTSAKLAALAVTSAKIANNAVGNVQLRQGVATSVIGRAGTMAGDVADIQAALWDSVLRRAGDGALDFGTINAGMIADAAVTSAKIASGAVVSGKLGADSVDSDQYVDGSIDPIHIANRTRKFVLHAVSLSLSESAYGVAMPNGQASYGYSSFRVPEDFVSDLNVKVVLVSASGATGNIHHTLSAYGGAAGEARDTNTASTEVDEAMGSTSRYYELASLNLTGWAVGDNVRLSYVRWALDAGDTIEATVYLVGFLVSYTADS